LFGRLKKVVFSRTVPCHLNGENKKTIVNLKELPWTVMNLRHFVCEELLTTTPQNAAWKYHNCSFENGYSTVIQMFNNREDLCLQPHDSL
jgi:hypothetical protein